MAIKLLKQGHTPIVYCTHLGTSTQTDSIVEELRVATVPVVDNLDAVGAVPDIIHGHHHPGTMTAMLHFPEVPGIFFCHDWLAWHDHPPLLPRIQYYVGVDYTCRDRLIFRHGISEDRVRVIYNSVDLDNSLPKFPKRALVFSNQASEHTYLRAVQQACTRTGIDLDVIGASVGNVCIHPEKVLGNYDLVFAKARCALEAMAVGCAVILCDYRGAGSMVTASEMSQLRRFNFGIRTLQEPVHPDVLVREITRYDSDDAAEVSRRIRETTGLNATVNEIVALYREAIASHQAKLIDSKVEAKAVSGYLYRWIPRYGEYEQLQASFSHLQTESERQQAEYSQLQIEFQQLQLKVNQLQAENGQIKEQSAQLQAERQRLQTEVTALYNSTMQLRQRLLKLPILGRIVLFLYRLVTGRLAL
ncbi:glycosyltransferase [Nostoc sp. KVJ3]|nr:glycosyltransferase [Nostoc sp. KVJ3]MCW5314064.1 glycosyltransferase [Nostoc sp. KVJ3]